MNISTKKLKSIFLLCLIITLIFLFSCSKTNNFTNDSDTETTIEHSHNYILSDTVEATCTVPGTQSYTCSCGASYNETIAPTGHDTDISFSYDLSTHFYICLKCGERTEEKEHIYSQRATAPSCDTNGYYLYFCICGFEYKEPIISTGHSYDEVSISFDEKFHYNSCTICGETKKSSHAFGSWNTKTEPKCEQEGLKERTCDYCEYSESDKISALTHNFNNKNVCVLCNLLNYNSTFSFELVDSSYYSITKIETSTEAYVVIPQVYNNMPVKKISENAFSDHTEIIGIYFPPTIEFVGKNAFSGCTNLKEVYYLGNIDTWCCIDFTNVNSNPMNYGERFYIDFLEATEITIPNSVNSLKNYSFYGFDNVKALTIPDTLTKFNDTTFENCHSLCDVYYQGTLKDWNNIIFTDYDSSPMYVAKNLYINNALLEHLNIKDVNRINDFAFSGVDSLKTVDIGDGVFTIGVRAFYNCTSLHKVIIGNDVSTIDEFAFYDCSNLLTLTLGKSIFEINDRAFQRCYKLLEIYNLSSLVIEKNTQYGYVGYYSKVINSDLSISSIIDTSIKDYLFTTLDNTNYLLSYIGNDTIISLPNDYYDSSYSIYEYAFFKNLYIESVTLSINIDSILQSSFRYCNNLKEVIFTDNAKWSIITAELKQEEISDSQLMLDYLANRYYNRTWSKIKE